MTILGIVLSIVISGAIGFWLGRLKRWIVQCEQEVAQEDIDKAPVTRTPLRIKGINIRGIVKP